jgi:hypothetical protein
MPVFGATVEENVEIAAEIAESGSKVTFSRTKNAGYGIEGG